MLSIFFWSFSNLFLVAGRHKNIFFSKFKKCQFLFMKLVTRCLSVQQILAATRHSPIISSFFLLSVVLWVTHFFLRQINFFHLSPLANSFHRRCFWGCFIIAHKILASRVTSSSNPASTDPRRGCRKFASLTGSGNASSGNWGNTIASNTSGTWIASVWWYT